MGTLEDLGRHLVLALTPLKNAVSSPENFAQFIYRLGWNATAVPPSYSNLAAKVDEAITELESLIAAPNLDKAMRVIGKVKAVVDAIDALSEAPPGVVDPGAFLDEVKERLFEILVTDYLSAVLPTTFNLFTILGVIEDVHSASAPGRPSFARLKINWDRIPQAVAHPDQLPQMIYGWGTAELQFDKLIQHLLELFHSLDIPVSIAPVDPQLSAGFLDVDAVDPLSPTIRYGLRLPFSYLNIGGVDREIGLVVLELPAADTKLPGIIIQPNIPSEIGAKLRVQEDVDLRIEGGSNIASQFGLLIRPDELSVKYPFQGGAELPALGFGVGLDYLPADSVLLLGSADSTRIEFQGATADFAFRFAPPNPEAVLGFDFKGLALVIQAAETDGFMRSILGAGRTKVDIPLGLEWSSGHGIKFKGGGGFEVAVSPHLSLGPISIEQMLIRLVASTDAPPNVKLTVGANVRGDLGPLQFVVQNIGLSLGAVFVKGGNVGPFDLRIGFKPPDGVGLSVDSGVIKGGGFLSFDADKGEYAGALELEFEGVVSVKAVGIINTKMPDGSSGFSLLVIIDAEFTPIQLGFGFTLLGVGGLLGLNRTSMLDALRTGIRDGSVESVLFPHDVVANAPRIINDLKRFFPPLDDRFLIGPMAKLGWGTPTLISIELGLILEIPRPAFAILGVLRVTLPADDIAILNLQVNFLGVIDFDKEQLSFDASLFDSHILSFALTGDMAVRLYWGEDANFLLTVGGFHPAYTPPPLGLGPLRRLAIDILPGLPRIRAESYFAVTSNTVQFGAKVELYAGASIFNVYGFMSYDVLIQFNPFHFIAEFSAMLAVRSGSHTLFGVRVEAVLEGPTPWHARGKGSFEIGFVFTITISVHFDVTFGESRTTTLPPIQVMPKLIEALQNPGNWRAILPPGTSQRVSLRELPAAGSRLVLHPVGRLEVSQKVVPLNLTISRFGTQRPENGTNFRISDVTLGAQAATPAAVKEQFAPAQFIEMSDAEKLSRKPFERYAAGIQVGGSDTPNADYVASLDVVYEVIYVPLRQLRVLFRLATALFDVLVRGAAVAKSPFSYAQRAPSALGTPRVALQSEKFGVATTRDLSLHDQTLVFDSEAEAHAALHQLTASDPGLSHELQVVPMYQVAA